MKAVDVKGVGKHPADLGMLKAYLQRADTLDVTCFHVSNHLNSEMLVSHERDGLRCAAGSSCWRSFARTASPLGEQTCCSYLLALEQMLTLFSMPTC